MNNIESLKLKSDYQYEELNIFYQKLNAMPEEEREKHKEVFNKRYEEYRNTLRDLSKAESQAEQEEINIWADYWINKSSKEMVPI